MHAGRTIVALAALALVGCSAGEKEKAGTVIGAGLGALTGAHVGKGKGKLVAVAVGTLAGAALGGEVGKSLDRADWLAMRRSTQTKLEKNRTGAASTWRNPDSENEGTVTPTRTYGTGQGQYCREYQQTITVGGKTEQGSAGIRLALDGEIWRLLARPSLEVRVDANTSPYGASSLAHVADPAVMIGMGGTARPEERITLEVALVEDQGLRRAVPDVGLHLAMRWRP